MTGTVVSGKEKGHLVEGELVRNPIESGTISLSPTEQPLTVEVPSTGYKVDTVTGTTKDLAKENYFVEKGMAEMKTVGMMSAIAITLHNIPEGIAVAIPIYYATKSKSKSLLYATLSGLTEPVGAGICYGITALSGIQIESAGAAFPLILSAVAGIMIYISLDELLPTAEKYGKHHIAIAGVVAGMAVMGVSLLLL